MKDTLVRLLATGAYAGRSPIMPGTLGTLWGVLIAYFTSALAPLAQALVIAVACVLSYFLARSVVLSTGVEDPQLVVCDEICGFLAAFFLIPFTPFNAILAFLFFRFFDILKPFPVGAIDRGIRGGAGVVLDDVAAGVYANASVRVVLWLMR
jgi:phosphatidylglycerophosphatase A